MSIKLTDNDSNNFLTGIVLIKTVQNIKDCLCKVNVNENLQIT